MIADTCLGNYPILPVFTEYAAELYAEALDDERNPVIFSKVGDSMTYSNLVTLQALDVLIRESSSLSEVEL